MRSIVRFIKDETGWVVSFISGDREHGYNLDHKWLFAKETGGDDVVASLRNDYALKAGKVKLDNYLFNIRIEFDDAADEAAFILLANSDGITIPGLW